MPVDIERLGLLALRHGGFVGSIGGELGFEAVVAGGNGHELCDGCVVGGEVAGGRGPVVHIGLAVGENGCSPNIAEAAFGTGWFAVGGAALDGGGTSGEAVWIVGAVGEFQGDAVDAGVHLALEEAGLFGSPKRRRNGLQGIYAINCGWVEVDAGVDHLDTATAFEQSHRA